MAMIAALCEVAPGSKAGIAVWPQDGHDAETLLLGALAAAKQAAPCNVAAARETSTVLDVGGKEIVIADPIMIQTYERISRLARSDLSVLITGETGTGKELAASALHYQSKRKNQQFMAFSCAGIPEDTADSELFGHEKGAFTGAIASKVGLFEKGNGGTVFLDEVGELSKRIQAKLLRALQERTIRRVGGTQDRPVDVRIISATNRDLEQEVKNGNFRADLFFRLNSAVIILPPLRARRREVPILARSFLARACKDMQRPQMDIADSTMDFLAQHAWPGNIRELKNLMDYAAAVIPEQTIEVEHIQERLGTLRSSCSDAVEVRPKFRPLNEEIYELLRTHLTQMTEVARTAVGIAAATTNEALPGGQKFRSIDDEIRELERRRIIEALGITAGNKTKAAELIEMPLTTFKSKLKEYGIASHEYIPSQS
jgi:DNA-binding NtrC family response regulator